MVERTVSSGSLTRPAERSRAGLLLYRVGGLLIWVLAAGLAYYYVDYFRRHPGIQIPANTDLGRGYGIAGAVLMALLVLYLARRQYYRRRLGRLTVWYRSHLLLGVLAAALVGCHAGFQMRNWFYASLVVGYWGALITGVLGWLIHLLLGSLVRARESRPMVLKEILAERDRLQSELKVEGNLPDAARQALARLKGRRLARLWLFPRPDSWDRDAETAAAGLPADQRARVRALNHLEALASYHRLLRGWTLLHLGFSLAIAQLAIWHIVMILLY